MNVPRKHKGALSELRASAWLLEQGYEVFRNVSAHGPIDIIARHPETGELLLLDVKTKHPDWNPTKNNSKFCYLHVDEKGCRIAPPDELLIQS